MKIKNGSLFLLVFLFLLISILGDTGCANIVAPMGGPRDTIPPRLVLATPHDSAKLFPLTAAKGTSNKIVFYFNEYIDPKDIRTELIVSPVPKTDPIVDSKLRTLTVRIKDTLEPNTTYSLNFGNAIRDVNEGNILKNFTYVFSTGKYIDSMQYSGHVIVANTGKIDSTLIVLLHKKLDDSAVVKSKPRYIARVDSTGRFKFRYLEPGKYALYAMKDEGGSHQYLSKGQLFAFADSPVVIGPGGTPPLVLYAYAEGPETKSGNKSSSSGGAKSSGGEKKSDKEKEKDKRLQFQTNLSNGVFDVLDTFRFQFPNPLKDFDSSKIKFTDENFQSIPDKDYRFMEGDTNNRLFYMLYTWPTDTKYHLILAKDFAQDSSGRMLLKTDTISFRTRKDIEYGEVWIRIFNLDLNRKPVLQFVVGDAVKYSVPLRNNNAYKTQLFTPGDYELRVLYDTNGNGVWDPGEFFGKHRQPEQVITVLKKFTVKPNWDNDKDITL